MNSDFDGRLEFAHRLADAAGAVIRPYFRKPLDVEDKKSSSRGNFDPVTIADKAAEQEIRALISQAYPGDGILGEEFGDMPGSTGFRWVLDPIDGTRAFITGQLMWGSLIALEKGNEKVLGLLDQPILRERFVGHGGRAEFISPQGNAPLTARRCAKLGDAVITTTHPLAHFSVEEAAQFATVESQARLSRYGGDCYAYGLLAMGFIDLVMEAGLRAWDTAALIPIVEGAGGIMTDWEGGPVTDRSSVLASGDAAVHAEVLALLGTARGKKA
jgi:histidinol phosphatase-like enzyme (inositol monophosphatase family)